MLRQAKAGESRRAEREVIVDATFTVTGVPTADVDRMRKQLAKAWLDRLDGASVMQQSGDVWIRVEAGATVPARADLRDVTAAVDAALAGARHVVSRAGGELSEGPHVTIR